jgi:hypothetical protein
MGDYLPTSTLTMDSSIVDLIIARVLLGRVGNFTKVLYDDRLLLWAIIKEKPVDWARLVQHHMPKGATGTTPLPYPTLITIILRHFGVNLADEYCTTIDGHNFEIGQSLLHRAGIIYAAENWYIQVLGIEGNRPKENYPDIDPEDLPEPDPEPLPPHFQQLSLQFS